MQLFVRIPAVSVSDTRMTEKDGTPVREQQALLMIEGGFAPLQFALRLGKGQSGYPVGDYDLAPETFKPGQYGSISVFVKVGPQLQAKPAVRAA